MKKALLALPVILVAVAALAFTGKINIPGITPKKAAKNALATYAGDKDKLAAKSPSKPTPPTPLEQKKQMPKPKVALATFDAEQGASALAKIWNEVPVPSLIKVVKTWKDEDLAKVLNQMDTGQVAKLITAMAADQPDRASALSKVLQKQSSVIPPPEES